MNTDTLENESKKQGLRASLRASWATLALAWSLAMRESSHIVNGFVADVSAATGYNQNMAISGVVTGVVGIAIIGAVLADPEIVATMSPLTLLVCGFIPVAVGVGLLVKAFR